jgi:2-oxoglutarate ferredoxin oxidoreductase subunit gamma
MGGEGGQGVQAAADILAQAVFEEGKEALYIPNFGIEQRGGVSLAFVQIGGEPIGSPKFKYAHLIVALSGRSLERLQGYMSEESIILYDSSLLAPPQVSDEVIGWQCYDTIAPEAFAERRLTDRRQSFPEIPRKVKYIFGLPASEMAQNKLHPRVANIIILGATARFTEIVQLESIKKALEERLANKIKRDPALKDLNYKALELGWEAAGRMIKIPVSTGKIFKR